MKQCPECKNTYTDESLKFCLADGTKLISLSDPEKTIAMNTADDETIAINAETDRRMRVDTSPNESPESIQTVISQKPPPTQQATRKGVSPVIVGVLVTLLLVVIIGFAGFVGYTFMKGNSEIASNSEIKKTPTPDDEIANLKKELANLKERTENQQNTEETPVPTLPPKMSDTAKVNSPRDGFLALRSEPGTETGYRVMKIPHNATVKIQTCREPSYVGKRRGRWCDVIYGDQRGWVFDAYLRR